MHVGVVQIGNSRGIRIPKRILDQLRIDGTVDLEVEGNRIILEPVHRKPRDGWAAAARRMREAEDDGLLIPEVFDDEDVME